jgi:hypothetical protein
MVQAIRTRSQPMWIQNGGNAKLKETDVATRAGSRDAKPANWQRTGYAGILPE